MSKRFSGALIIQADQTDHIPTVAASTYLNTAPLIWSFTHGERRGELRLLEAVPARCAELLAQGEVEVALVPSIEYQRISNVTAVPGVCIGSLEKVRSVVLVSRLPDLKNIRRVALDQSSRTSATLVKIIFREFLNLEPQWTSSLPDVSQMLEGNDAALLIGDPAMTFSRKGLRVFDLATLWREYTKLGFIFAMWMFCGDASREVQAIDFQALRDEGLMQIEDIVRFYQPLLNLPATELRKYLNVNISFSPEPEMVSGLELYYRLAHKHGLISSVKPLRLAAA